MGLSLGNLGKKITDFAGGLERQINPFDKGATWANPNPVRQPVVAPRLDTPLNAARLGIGAAAGAVGDFGVGFLRGIARIPETVVRSVAQPGAQIFDPNATTSQVGENTGVRKFFYGKEPVKTYIDQGQDIGKSLAQVTKQPGLEKYGVFAAPVLAGLDLTGGGKKEVTEQFAKAATKGAVEQIAKKEGLNLSKQAVMDLVKSSDRSAVIKVLEDAAKAKPKVSLKPNTQELAMGKALGMSESDVAKAKVGLATPNLEKPLAATVKLNNRAAAIKAGMPAGIENAPVPINLPAAAEGQSKQAILNSKAVRGLINERVAPAIEAANRLSPADHALLDETRTTAAEVLAKRAENPQAFLDAAAKAKNYTDYVHALGTGSGQVLGYRQKYGAPLLYDLKHQPTVDALAQTEAKLRKTPGYAKTRTTGNYVPGLQRLNQNFAQDLAHDASMRGGHISEMALSKGLEEAFPGQVAIGNIPRGYTQLQIASGRAISMPDAIARKLNSRAAAPQVENIALKGYDALNRGAKYTSLAGGLFHGATTAETAVGQQLASGNIIKHPIENLRAVAGSLSSKIHTANMEKYAAEGTLDNARLAGVTLKPSEILADANIKFLDKAKLTGEKLLSPFHEMVFGRQIPEAKLLIFRQETKGLNPNIPADMEKMRQVASAVNNFGGVNRAVEGLTPKTAQQVSRGVLATDFTETKVRKLVDAVSKGGPQGKIARQMVIGKVIVAAIPGLAIAAAAGKLNSPHDWANEMAKQAVDPQFDTSFKSPKGYSKVAKVPGTEISELSRVFLPLFDGSPDPLSGAKHYGTARLAAGPATIWSLLNNQDYYGNPIIAQDAQGNIDVGKSAQNIATSRGPIPLQQGVKVAQGKESVGEALVNIGGARVVINPNDPKYKEVQQHFANQDKFVAGLNPNEKNLFNKMHPAQKDANGNQILSKNKLTKTSDYGDLIANPDFAAKYQSYQQSQPSHDPLWDLNPNQLRSYMQAQIIGKNDPGGDSTTTRQLYARLPQDFFTKRTAYFDSLKASGVNLGGTDYVQRPKMPDALQKFADSYHNLPYGTGARSSALRSSQGQAYIAYLDQNRIYNNQERADLGLPPLEAPANSANRYGTKSKGSSDPYRYAVSLSAGGATSKPKVSVKKATASKRVARAKPKVSIRRSLV